MDKLEDKVKVLTVVKMAQGARLTHIDARVERLEQDMQALTLQVSCKVLLMTVHRW